MHPLARLPTLRWLIVSCVSLLYLLLDNVPLCWLTVPFVEEPVADPIHVTVVNEVRDAFERPQGHARPVVICHKHTTNRNQEKGRNNERQKERKERKERNRQRIKQKNNSTERKHTYQTQEKISAQSARNTDISSVGETGVNARSRYRTGSHDYCAANNYSKYNESKTTTPVEITQTISRAVRAAITQPNTCQRTWERPCLGGNKT